MSYFMDNTHNGIPYEDFVTGPQGARFILHPVKDVHTEDQVVQAIRELKVARDVVGMKVAWWTRGKDVQLKYFFLQFEGSNSTPVYVSSFFQTFDLAHKAVTLHKMKAGKPLPNSPEVTYEIEHVFEQLDTAE